MEMDPTKLDLDSLPRGERRFIDLIVSGIYPAYGAGFMAEWATLNQLAQHFRHLNEYANIALLRVGSGGRFEGGALGETEFVLLTKDDMGPDWAPGEDAEEGYKLWSPQFYDILVRTSSSDIIGVGITRYMKVSLEHKRLDSEKQLSYYADNDTPYPGRILEGEYVAGNRDLVTEARRKVFAEIVGDPKVIKGLKKDLKVYRKVCETGMSRKDRQFDLDKNEMYFNPPNRQHGMKYGLLRYVQTALSIELFDLFVRKQFPIEEFLDLNQSVEERIRYAFRKGWVANADDLTIAGIMYVQATDFNNTAKINYYTDETSIFKPEEGSLREIHEDIVSIFENQLLID